MIARAASFAAALALAIGTVPANAHSTIASATSAPPLAKVAAPRPIPKVTPTPIPTPKSVSPERLPYPAYGTPAPGVSRTQIKPDVPMQITLQQAIDIAVAKSPVLASAHAAFDQTRAQLDLAKTGLLPNLAGTVGLSRSDTLVGSNGRGTTAPGAPQSNGSLGGGGSTSLTADATLRQLIFDGGRTRTQILAAGQGYSAGGNTFRRQLQTVAFTVAQNYFNALQAEDAVALDQQIVEQNLVQERLVRAQIRAGTVARADIAQALFPVAQARVNLIRAQGAELVADSVFANALGLDADTAVRPATSGRVESTQSLLQTQPLDYAAAVTRALLERPDYAAAQETLQQAQYGLKAAKLGRFPTLTGNASLNSGSTFPNGGGFRATDAIGASLNVPLFDQGITAAQTEQASATLENARALETSSQLNVQLSVRQALINLVSAQAALVQAQAELAQAQSAVRATQAQYRAGVTTLPLLLNAEVSLTQAQTDRLNAIYALRQAEQAYLYALGEIDITSLNV